MISRKYRARSDGVSKEMTTRFSVGSLAECRLRLLSRRDVTTQPTIIVHVFHSLSFSGRVEWLALQQQRHLGLHRPTPSYETLFSSSRPIHVGLCDSVTMA